MKIYVQSTRVIPTDAVSPTDRRYYVFALMNAVGLDYQGREVYNIPSEEFGELGYEIKAKRERYFLEIFTDYTDPTIADKVAQILQDCIHDYRIPNAYIYRDYGNDFLRAVVTVRNIPAIL